MSSSPNPALTGEVAGFASKLANSVTNAERHTHLFMQQQRVHLPACTGLLESNSMEVQAYSGLFFDLDDAPGHAQMR